MWKRLCLCRFPSNTIIPSLSSSPQFSLPQSYGPVTIHSLGTICSLPAFYSSHFIYPIGYSATYQISMKDWVECTIGKNDSNQPVFSVKLHDKVFHSSTPTNAWKLVLDEVSSNSSNDLSSSSSPSNASSTLLPHNGLVAFGLSIPEIALAIASLPGVNECTGFEHPFPTTERIQNQIDWMSVLSSQWHPACRDFAMTENGHLFKDASIYSPIFFGMSDLPSISCSVCHIPPTQLYPLQCFTLSDVDTSISELLRNGKWNGGSTTTLWAHSSCGAFILKRMQGLIKQLRVQLIE